MATTYSIFIYALCLQQGSSSVLVNFWELYLWAIVTHKSFVLEWSVAQLEKDARQLWSLAAGRCAHGQESPTLMLLVGEHTLQHLNSLVPYTPYAYTLAGALDLSLGSCVFFYLFIWGSVWHGSFTYFCIRSGFWWTWLGVLKKGRRSQIAVTEFVLHPRPYPDYWLISPFPQPLSPKCIQASAHM